MAEEFQTGVCGGGSWWNATKGGFDLSASVAAGASTASCSASVSDAGGFGWSTMEAVEGRAPGFGEDSVAPTASGGGSSVTFQEAPSVHVSYPMPGSGFLLESTLPMVDFGLSSPTTAEWNQALHRSSGKIDLGGFPAMVQYDPSSRSYFRHGTDLESHQITPENESMDLLKGMNHGFIQDDPHVNSGGEPGDCTAGSFPTLLQRLFDQEVKPQTASSYDNRSSSFMAPATSFDRLSSSEDASQAAWSKFPHMLKVSPAEQPPPSPQLQFSNNTPFWNASEVAADARSGYYPLPQPPFATHRKFEEKPVGGTLPAKCIPTEKRSGKNEAAFKKPRVETPSSLPTFKVRKEKLGDRITALQQLVSPFGKTDTASVLLEAIEYIKFLHEQVSVLSTPYLKGGQGIQQQQNSEKMKDGDGPKQDLRSRGLCLVPISSTFAVANEPISDFWTPTFGGITYK